jgi:glucokinase
MAWAIGVDLGGTKLEVGLVDENGQVIRRRLFSTRVLEGPSAIVSDIVEGVHQLSEGAEAPIVGVGVGMAGQIESKTGVVHFAPNLKWHRVPLRAELNRLLRLPIQVTNDVRAATWGEWMHGAGKGIEDLLCVFIGTGIGGGVISGGKLLTGHRNAAGEVGHMPIDFHGPLCGCGNKGCFEAYAGGWAIARRAQELIAKDPAEGAHLTRLAGWDHPVTAKNVFEAARQNDPLAKKIVEEVTQALIAGMTGLVNAFNPHCIVLGGGVIHGMPEFIPLIREGVMKCALKAATEDLQIASSILGGDAGVVGAASIVREQVSHGVSNER